MNKLETFLKNKISRTAMVFLVAMGGLSAQQLTMGDMVLYVPSPTSQSIGGGVDAGNDVIISSGLIYAGQLL